MFLKLECDNFILKIVYIAPRQVIRRATWSRRQTMGEAANKPLGQKQVMISRYDHFKGVRETSNPVQLGLKFLKCTSLA